MGTTSRRLPYTRQLVTIALYEVLEQERCEYRNDKQSGSITADLTVYGNKSGFTANVREQGLATELIVAVTKPCEGLSEEGKKRAADYLADRVAQLLENEIKINALLKANQGAQEI